MFLLTILGIERTQNLARHKKMVLCTHTINKLQLGKYM